MWLGVPWIGYPFVMDGGWVLLAAAALAAFVLALATGRRTPQKVVGHDPDPLAGRLAQSRRDRWRCGPAHCAV